ncbi:hypothetical protein DV451_004179 [Geotrichum candidum]|uniref:Ribosomal RNA-processing protein 1 n=1 Tax=Geotrichum candidum TaxID=1173061 RepID=A0A9P5G425_GEOCN|nr:hypothetical protein DV451_004179 [Geotrichum candidum]KAF5106480.1 hypothetical protein DV453_003889 [Geotrichum candidum]
MAKDSKTKLKKVKSSKESKPKSEPFAPEAHPFIKKLAANDRPTRDKALEALGNFLQTSKKIPEMEALKLWRGLFYSMWFSDRPRTQQKLADDLAGLLSKLKPVNFFTFLDAFWVIMAREWENLDVHRLDKFLMLLRRYVTATFRRLKAEGWDSKWVEDYNKVARHIPLNTPDHKVSNGIRFHMFDIYLDELEHVVKEGEDINEEEDIDWKSLLENVPVKELLQPIEEISNDSKFKIVRENAAEVLKDSRLITWGILEAPTLADDESEDEEESEDEWGGFE